MHSRTHPTVYKHLEALPEGVTGEIIDGQLYARPRPNAPHGLAGSDQVRVAPFDANAIDLNDLWVPQP